MVADPLREPIILDLTERDAAVEVSLDLEEIIAGALLRHGTKFPGTLDLRRITALFGAGITITAINRLTTIMGSLLCGPTTSLEVGLLKAHEAVKLPIRHLAVELQITLEMLMGTDFALVNAKANASPGRVVEIEKTEVFSVNGEAHVTYLRTWSVHLRLLDEALQNAQKFRSCR